MSAAPQTVQAQTGAKPAPLPSAWRSLRGLFPYVARYKGGVVGGLVTLALMGVLGTLPQILIGAITDSLTNNSVPLRNLTGFSRSLLNWLFYFYQPLNRRTLLIFCAMLVVVVAAKGVFSFLSRWILIGISRDIEYDLRNDLLARLMRLEPEFFVRNRTGELMSRCTNDLNAVRMVLGPGIMYSATTLVTMILAIFFMVNLSPALSSLGAAAGSFRRRLRVVFRRCDPPPFGTHSGGAGHSFRASRRKSRRSPRNPRLCPGTSGNPQIRRSQSGLRHAQPQTHRRLEHVHARAAGPDRHHVSARALARRPAGDDQSHFSRRR